MKKDIKRVKLIKELPQGIGASFELGKIFEVAEFKPGRVRVYTTEDRLKSLSIPNDFLEIVEG